MPLVDLHGVQPTSAVASSACLLFIRKRPVRDMNSRIDLSSYADVTSGP